MVNKIYQIGETAIQWLASGGDELLTLTSLAASAGRQGARHDFGTSARSPRFVWRFYTQFATAPVVGERIEIYWKSSDGTHADNDDGTGDIALSSQDKLNNLQLLGVMTVDEATASVEMGASGTIEIGDRYGQPVIYNATADALSSTAAESGFTLTPIPFEVQ